MPQTQPPVDTLWSVDTSWPPEMSVTERAVILDDFVTLHQTTIAYSIGALRHSLKKRLPRDISPYEHAFAISLQYNPDSDGNPATRLALKKIEVLDVKTQRGKNAAADSLGSGQLTILYYTGGIQTRESLMWRNHSAEEDLAYDAFWADWLTHMRVGMTTGIIQVVDDNDQWWMVKKGRVWELEKTPMRQWRAIQKSRRKYLGPEPEIDTTVLFGSA